MTSPRSAVVVLNFHGRQDTLDCVAHLVEGSPDHDVVVVDNGSHDGTVEAVRERWPHVHTHQNQTNLGFAGGMNTGLRWAQARDYEVVTVLNNDTIVPAGAMDLLVARAGDSPVAVSPVVLYRDDADRVWFAGGRNDPDDGLPRHLVADELAALGRGVPPSIDGSPYTTELLAGCCVTASAATWKRVGLFDERYFLNFEDAEWSLRARRADIGLEVVPAVRILHSVSASFVGAYSYLGFFYYARNSLRYARAARLGVRRTARLVRHRVLPDPVRAARDDGLVEGARRGVVLLVALGSALLGVSGRAPRRLESLTRRWSATAT